MLETIRRKVLEQADISNDLSDDELRLMIDDIITKESKKTYISLGEKNKLRSLVFSSIRGLDVLEELLFDPTITEIMVNSSDTIFIERDGRIEESYKTFTTPDKLLDVIQQIAANSNKSVNESSPIVDTRLSDGSRVNIVMNPIAIDGHALTIRKFNNHTLTMKKLVEVGAINKHCADFLNLLVQARYNIFISGGTGSGKTTFLNALSEFIPSDERIITIEDSAELVLRNQRNVVRLEARSPNSEGAGAISIRDLIRTSLRMRPDRIIVGEVRGDEAIDMLQAMNTGHDGSLSTGHGNSIPDMLSRLETMVYMGMNIPLKAIRSMIASSIDIMIHLGRLRDDSRRVLSVYELSGVRDEEYLLDPLFEFIADEGSQEAAVIGELCCKGELKSVLKLKNSGLYEEWRSYDRFP